MYSWVFFSGTYVPLSHHTVDVVSVSSVSSTFKHSCQIPVGGIRIFTLYCCHLMSAILLLEVYGLFYGVHECEVLSTCGVCMYAHRFPARGVHSGSYRFIPTTICGHMTRIHDSLCIGGCIPDSQPSRLLHRLIHMYNVMYYLSERWFKMINLLNTRHLWH